MKSSFILSFCFALNTVLFADDICGRVVSELNGMPIIGAEVYFKNTTYGSSTNDKGEFCIENIPPGTYTICVDYVGYTLAEQRKITIPDMNNQSPFCLPW